MGGLRESTAGDRARPRRRKTNGSAGAPRLQIARVRGGAKRSRSRRLLRVAKALNFAGQREQAIPG